MITYTSTTLTCYNSISAIEVYYYKSTSSSSLSGGSWSTTKPTWENGKYVWQKLKTIYEDGTYVESDPVNITGQQGVAGTAAYSYKLNASSTIITKSKIGEYATNTITFNITYKQGTGNINPYAGRFKIETSIDGITWIVSYTSSVNESSKVFTIPTDIMVIKCSVYQANGISVLLDQITIPVITDERPIYTKTYTGLIGSTNDTAGASFYFAKINPIAFTTNYRVKLKIRVIAPTAYAETIDIQFGGYGNSFSSYDSYTTKTNSTGIYYVSLYRATQTGINNNKGHALGISLKSASNPTNTSYKRDITVNILELDGCTLEMLDTAVKYADWDGAGSTNYSGVTEMAVATAGQNATNNVNTHYSQYSNAVKVGAFGVKRYTLIMRDTDNTWVSFVNEDNVKDPTKTVSTGGHILGKLLYSAGNAVYTANTNTSTIYDAYPFDFRYSANCASTLTLGLPVYLVGTVKNDGLFYLDPTTWWTQTVPTSVDDKVYIYVGNAYSTYQVWLSIENPAYQFYNGEFALYENVKVAKSLASLQLSLEDQIDGKVETWCQPTNPATVWTTTDLKNQHNGDLWYYTGESTSSYINNNTYQYNAQGNTWTAYSTNVDLFDKIDNKATIYYGTPTSITTADSGDYLVDPTDGCSYRRNNNTWIKVTDYRAEIDAIEIGGRNYFAICKSTPGYLNTTGTEIVNPSSIQKEVTSDFIPVVEGESICIQTWLPELEANQQLWLSYVFYSDKDMTTHIANRYAKSGTTGIDKYLAYNNITAPATASYIRVSYRSLSGAKVKVEKGNKPTDWSTAIEDSEMEIGGRNLLLGTKTQNTSLGNYRNSVTETTDKLFGCTVFKSSTAWADIGFNFQTQIINRGLAKVGDRMTYSIWAKTDDTETRSIRGIWVGSYLTGVKIADLTSEWTQYSKTFTVTQAMMDNSSASIPTRFECNTACSTDKYIYWAAPKLERGDKATDWTIAPEDIDNDITNAAKTANNYLSSDNTGIIIADLADGQQTPSTVTGNNVYITAGYGSGNNAVPAGMQIREGQTALARFEADNVRIGKENSGHTDINAGGMVVYEEHGDTLAEIGYGQTYKQASLFTSKYYTFGNRKSGSQRGYFSFAQGQDIIASNAHQAVFGKYNKGSVSLRYQEEITSQSSTTISLDISNMLALYAPEDIHVSASNSECIYSFSINGNTLTITAQMSAPSASDIEPIYEYDADGNIISITMPPLPSGTVAYVTFDVYAGNRDSALVIGNGSSDSSRSNAFEIDWNGGCRFACDTSSHGDIVDINLYNAITSQGWEGDVIV